MPSSLSVAAEGWEKGLSVPITDPTCVGAQSWRI